MIRNKTFINILLTLDKTEDNSLLSVILASHFVQNLKVNIYFKFVSNKKFNLIYRKNKYISRRSRIETP